MQQLTPPSSHSRNTQFSAIAIVVSVGIAFFLSPFVLIKLGPTRFGIWAILNTLLGLYGFLDLGVRAAFEHRLTRAVYRRNQKYVNHVFGTGQHLTTMIGSVTALVSIIAASAIAFTGLVPTELRTEVAMCTLVYGCLTAAKFLFFPYQAIISAVRRFDLNSQLGIATSIAVGISSAFSVYLSPSLAFLSIFASVPVFCSLFGSRMIARRLYPGIVPHPPSRRVRKLLLRTGVLRIANGISNHISWHIDSVTIAAICGVANVAGYSIAASVSFNFLTTARIYGPTVFGHASQAYAERRIEELERLFVSATRYCSLFAIPIAVISVIHSKAFFALWLDGSPVVATQRPDIIYSILAGSTLAILMSVPATQVLLASEKMRLVAILTMLEAATNLSLSIGLGIAFGTIGVASATVIASVFLSFPARIVAAAKSTETGFTKFCNQAFARPMLCTLLFVPIAFLIRGSADIDSWFTLISKGAYCVIAWSVIAIVLGISRHEQAFVAKRISGFASRISGTLRSS